MDEIRRELTSLRRQVRLLSAVALLAALAAAGALGGGTLDAARALVSGGVLFEGAGAVTTQDGANFFWDDANNRLGLGTSTPASRLDVNGTTRLRSTASFGSSGQEAEVAWSSNVGNGEPGTFFRAKAGRSAVLGSNGNLAGVTVNASGDVTVNEGGLIADFRVESDTDPNAVFLNGLSGNLGLGTDTPGARLDLNGGLIIRPQRGPDLVAHYTHDYPGGNAGVLRISPTLQVPSDFCRITGITGGVDGRILILHNMGPYTLVLLNGIKPEAALSQPQNRFGGAFPLNGYWQINAGESFKLIYDGLAQRWKQLP